MSHESETDGPCCDACEFDLPCETDCPDQSAVVNMEQRQTSSMLARIANLLSKPIIQVQSAAETATQILREVRAPVLEGKSFAKDIPPSLLYLDVLKFPTPPRGYRPEVAEVRFCVGDGTSPPGPAVPFELAWVPHGTTPRDAEFTIDKGPIINRSLACYGFNGGSLTQFGASIVVAGGTPLRVPSDPQSGLWGRLFIKADLTLSLNPGRITIHTRWVPAHECFPPGTTRRPVTRTV